MGTARIEVVRLANKHTLYPTTVDRRSPNPLEVISYTSSTSSGTANAISVQDEYQDLFARVKVDEAARVGLGAGSTDSSGGYELGAAEWSPWIPVRGGDLIEVIDLA